MQTRYRWFYADLQKVEHRNPIWERYNIIIPNKRSFMLSAERRFEKRMTEKMRQYCASAELSDYYFVEGQTGQKYAVEAFT